MGKRPTGSPAADALAILLLRAKADAVAAEVLVVTVANAARIRLGGAAADLAGWAIAAMVSDCYSPPSSEAISRPALKS